MKNFLHPADTPIPPCKHKRQAIIGFSFRFIASRVLNSTSNISWYSNINILSANCEVKTALRETNQYFRTTDV